MNLTIHKKGIILFFFVIIFFTELLRTAWITDDAIITLRTVLNFINGYGAVFNVGERVQAYTHPLWFLLISIISFIIKNVFIATFFLCSITTLCTFLIWFNKLLKNNLAGFVAMEVIVFSKAFVDFSTSGLENPLSHLLIVIAIYFVLKLQKDYQPISFFNYLFACSCLYLTRPDLILVFIPLTLVIFAQYRRNYKSILKITCFAALPVIIWSLFSLFYYGVFFPNTAYAKLGAGIELADRIHQGVFYFIDSIHQDPITLSFVVIGIVCGAILSNYYKLLTLGTILYLCYIVIIGGDFMSGRFFTAPLLLCLIFITETHFHKIVYIILALLAFKIGVDNIQNTLFSNRDFQNVIISKSGIADERGVYFQSLGLITNKPSVILFNIPEWKSNSLRKVIVTCGHLGLIGLKGGPDLHVIDQCALADPLLARLPAKSFKNWRIGHFYRQLPDGYFETVAYQKNLLVDSKLKKFYSHIKLITQGDLISFARLKAIFSINRKGIEKSFTHIYRDQYINYSPVEIDYAQLNSKALSLDTPLQYPDNLFFIDHLSVRLLSAKSIKSIDLTLSYFNNGYRINYLANNHIVFTSIIKPPLIANTPLLHFKLNMVTQIANVDTISISSIDESFKSGHYIGYIEVN